MEEYLTFYYFVLSLFIIILYLLYQKNIENFFQNEENIDFLVPTDCLKIKDDKKRETCFSQFSGPMI